jgi:hypothetical protein
MKKTLLLSTLLCCTLFIFAQERPHGIQTRATGKSGNKNDPNPDSWKPGTILFNDGKDNLELDTSLFTIGGFTSLRAEAISTKPTEFKFKQDKFVIQTLNDFKLDYYVKRTFQAGIAGFTLYLYSGNLIIYKRDYTITFDGKLMHTVMLKGK